MEPKDQSHTCGWIDATTHSLRHCIPTKLASATPSIASVLVLDSTEVVIDEFDLSGFDGEVKEEEDMQLERQQH
jgi:hypothetical protein